MHESLHREQTLKLPPNRSFGLGVAICLLVIALFPLWGGGGVRLWAVAGAAACALIALLEPNIYTPLNRAWMRFGLILNKIVNPLVLGVMFYVVIWPTGIALRLIRGTSLRQGYDVDASSYWEPRTPPGPKPKSLERQF